MKMQRLGLAPLGIGLLLAGCGAHQVRSSVGGAGGALSESAAEEKASFGAALAQFESHEQAGWNKPRCSEVAASFEKASSLEGPLSSLALYNAAVARLRCQELDEARSLSERALKLNPNNHHARAHLVRDRFGKDHDVDTAIAEMQKVVLGAQFQNVPALVDLATFQMLRSSNVGRAGDCADDMDCAKRNLQRALAIDDGYMPAFNQLALYYLKRAKGGRKRSDVQQLELAALVCSQAIRKNPNDAVIHNTAGLIQTELGQVNGAVAEFATATKLAPAFVEAQMNYAAINLSFRGFASAESAYRQVVALEPDNYQAHLGLALALRGQIDDMNHDQQVAAVEAELATCKSIDPKRPDAFYNEGILTQEFKAKGGGDKAHAVATLQEAKQILEQFVQKANGNGVYRAAVARAQQRSQDIGDTIQFLNLEAETVQASASDGTHSESGTAASKSSPSKSEHTSVDSTPKGR